MLALLAVGAATLVTAAEPSFQELEESLTCQCGCGLTVHSCNHLQCPSAIPLRQEIRAQIALGKGKDDVLAHFAEKYGEKILSSPTMTGFNLAAWVTPFVAVGIGMMFVFYTLLSWRRRTVDPAATTATPTETREPDAAGVARAEQLERELKDFDS